MTQENNIMSTSFAATISPLVFLICCASLYAQNDTIYFMKEGEIVNKQSIIPSDIDSVVFYRPQQLYFDTFTDTRDGVVYKSIALGNQVWMAENLKYLPSVVEPETGSLSDSYYYVYGYHGTNVADAKATANYETYGVLYNWPAAMGGETSWSDLNPSGIQGACPAGWHLPSVTEWEELENYLADNGYNYDGTTGGGSEKIAKAMGNKNGWMNSTNTGAVGNTDYPTYRNKSGFSALPGGSRSSDGIFYSIGAIGYWWNTTEMYAYLSWYLTKTEEFGSVHMTNYYKNLGLSIRCVKDE